MTPSMRRRLALAAALVAGVLTTAAVSAGAATAERRGEPQEPKAAPAAQQDSRGAERRAERDERKADRRQGQDQRKVERRARRDQRKAERRAGRTASRAAQTPATAGPAFVCDPALSHGQNVSVYARSLPKGPGRGRLVSQAARSDCGRPSADD